MNANRKQTEPKLESASLKSSSWFGSPAKTAPDGCDEPHTILVTKPSGGKSDPISGQHMPTKKEQKSPLSGSFPRTPQSDLSMNPSPVAPKTPDWPWYSAILAESGPQEVLPADGTMYLAASKDVTDDEEEHLQFLRELWRKTGLDESANPPIGLSRLRKAASEIDRSRRYGMHSVFLDKMSGLGDSSDSRRELLVDGYVRPHHLPLQNETYLPGSMNYSSQSR